MNEATNSGPAQDLLTRTLNLIKERHGTRMSDEPHTRELLAVMIAVGIREEATLVQMVELSGGKRYDPATASFH